MANQDQVARLQQGVAAWNVWRAKNKSVVPDLSNARLPQADLRGANLHDANLVGAILSTADLRGADLSGAIPHRANLSGANLYGANLYGAILSTANLHRANLHDANLHGANLHGANLSTANLHDANLRGASLSTADLRGANLRGADLRGADLSGAILSSADLRGTILSTADLRGADLSDASFYDTFFTNVDLSNVIGLDTCNHRGPSSVDHRTLEQNPNLPLAFLRGVGLPDRLIDYLPSLFNQPIQFYSCFISYSVKDEEFAARLYADLQNKGVRCWFDKHDLPIGAEILDEIDEAIRLRDKVLLVLSKASIKSKWVKKEVTTAFEEEDKRGRGKRMLFPIRLDDTVKRTPEAWAAQLRARNIGDFRHWKDHDKYQKSLERVLRDLSVASEPAARQDDG